ncbi:hypothetical protein RPD_2388 [Rhodopseudomonas palustris BisB5]|uniref:Uncharacterized protein n=1 Tax=Rhodopseudomonas palustris (strain BisB5) TaxID=316057 RepID=Q137X0_RHOPS|nr:hypothetical protein RPD_2388 [Rhodopseudomonas palustris BisB5]
MISVRIAGKETIEHDALVSLLNRVTFVGFIALDFVAKVIHRLLCPRLITVLLATLSSVLAPGSGNTLLDIPRLLGQTDHLAKSLSSAQDIILVAMLGIALPHVVAALWRQHLDQDAALGRVVARLHDRM